MLPCLIRNWVKDVTRGWSTYSTGVYWTSMREGFCTAAGLVGAGAAAVVGGTMVHSRFWKTTCWMGPTLKGLVALVWAAGARGGAGGRKGSGQTGAEPSWHLPSSALPAHMNCSSCPGSQTE